MAKHARGCIVPAILVLTLIASSFLVSNILDTLQTGIPVALGKPLRSELHSGYGTLLVDVLVGVRASTISVGIPDETVSVTASEFPSAAPLLLSTNFTGLAQSNLPEGNYTVVINENRFRAEARVPVLAGKMTFLMIRALRVAYPVIFMEFRDTDATGWAARNDTIFVRLPSDLGMGIAAHGLFIETERYIGQPPMYFSRTADIATHLTGGKVASNDTRSGTSWLRLYPDEAIRMTGVERTSLVVYVPTYTVAMQSI